MATVPATDHLDEVRSDPKDESHEPARPAHATTRVNTALVAASLGALVTGGAAFLRLWHLNVIGFNSDEVVYSSQAASLAGDPHSMRFFPIFRAHPLLFQSILSLLVRAGGSIEDGRILVVGFGLATVGVVYMLGSFMYGRRAGFAAAAVLAVMPYHVLVTRQVLLDGPMVLFATGALYLLARAADSGRPAWLYSASAALGLTYLSNERSIVLVGAAYVFIVLTTRVTIQLRHLIGAGVIFVVIAGAAPVSVAIAGKSDTGGQFFVWQLLRQSNHNWSFYFTQTFSAVGFAVLVAAVAGLWSRRQLERTWREGLLLIWIVMPFGFFELWPVKGFHYLLPMAPPIAVLAGRGLARLTRRRAADGSFPGAAGWRLAVGLLVIAAVIGVTAASSWSRLQPTGSSGAVLAGAGGVPGGREAGTWIRDNVPDGAQLLTIGPSMANLVMFYGERKAYGLSVSTNPLHRNPVYEPVRNPDRQLRSSEIHYLVWDSYSADRSSTFARKLLSLAERFHGRVVHTEYVDVAKKSGASSKRAVVVVYQVRP